MYLFDIFFVVERKIFIRYNFGYSNIIATFAELND